MKKKLPKKWCIIITNSIENTETIVKWYADKTGSKTDQFDLTIGNFFTIDEESHTYNGWMHHAPDRREGFEEITFEEFNRLVLNITVKPETPEDYSYLITFFKERNII